MNMTKLISRRQAMLRAGFISAAAAAAPEAPSALVESEASRSQSTQFLLCLNTATIRGQKLGIVREIEITAKAGYQAIEPWVDSIEEYRTKGGSLTDLKKRIVDAGLTVESIIAFPEWIVDDDAKRGRAIERAKREMDLAAQIGAKRFAAPPAGANDLPGLDLSKAAERYRALLELGDGMGLTTQLELWGFSKHLKRLGECAYVAIESGHPKACLLLDVYHLYKGGSSLEGLRLLSGNAVQVLHMNDYPADPPREKIDDSYRRYSGDGIAPISDILRQLRTMGGVKVLSLELFNRELWKQDPLEVARTGLQKMQAIVSALEKNR
jgi:2-keto-myo-inositol isomerase